MKRTRLWMGIGVLVVAAPLAWGISKARQEFSQAVRSPQNMERGAKIFATCAACHGPDGSGVQDGTVPRIAGQHFRVLVKQLVDYRHDARWDVRMERFADKHLLADAQAIADVAGYVSQLPSQSSPGIGTGQLLEKGAQLYAAQCKSCHGDAGEGAGSKGVPRIGGQHFEYVLRQMYDAVDGRRPNFSRKHIALLAKLDRDELVAIADFVSRSSWAGAPAASPK